MKKYICGAALILCGYQMAFSQENHYWSQQFGAIGSLTGGAMIAGVRDNSAAYYNPGALSFIDYPNLSVDANIYKLDQIYVVDGAGDGSNLNSAQMNIYPQILAGMLNYIKVPRLKFSYSILTRNFNNILLSTRYTQNAASGGEMTLNKFLGEFDYINQMNEQWFGLCASYRLSDKLGIGVTVFGTYRGQTTSITNNTRKVYVVDSTGFPAFSNQTESFKYMAFGLLAKFGIAYETGHWRFGLSLTTPSIGIYGNGSVRREELSYSSVVIQNNGNSIILAENSSCKARYHHPLAIGIGVEYNSRTTKISVSGEFYSKINSYYTMNPGSDAFVFFTNSSDSIGMHTELEQFLYVGNAAKPLFNVGVGVNQAVGKQFSLLFGARTDFSSFTPATNSETLLPGTGSWDLYYLSAGASYHQTRQTITAGFTYSFSPHLKIDPMVKINPGSSAISQATVFAQSFGVVLGYTYYFPR
jgi:hypothetical protein